MGQFLMQYSVMSQNLTFTCYSARDFSTNIIASRGLQVRTVISVGYLFAYGMISKDGSSPQQLKHMIFHIF